MRGNNLSCDNKSLHSHQFNKHIHSVMSDSDITLLNGGKKILSSILFENIFYFYFLGIRGMISFFDFFRKYQTPTSMLYLYKVQIRAGMGCCCHIWVGAATLLSNLDWVQKWLNSLVRDELFSTRQPLSHMWNTANHSILYCMANYKQATFLCSTRSDFHS